MPVIWELVLFYSLGLGYGCCYPSQYECETVAIIEAVASRPDWSPVIERWECRPHSERPAYAR